MTKRQAHIIWGRTEQDELSGLEGRVAFSHGAFPTGVPCFHRVPAETLTPSEPRESMYAARGLMLSRDPGGIRPLRPARESMTHRRTRESASVGKVKRKLGSRLQNREAHPGDNSPSWPHCR